MNPNHVELLFKLRWKHSFQHALPGTANIGARALARFRLHQPVDL